MINRNSLIDAEYIFDASLFDRYVFANEPLRKIAGEGLSLSSFKDTITDWFSSMIDPARPIESVMNIAFDGAVMILSPWWASLIYWIAEEYFGFNLFAKLKECASDLMDIFKSKGQLITRDIKQVVSSKLGDSASAFDHVTAKESETNFRKVARAERYFRNHSILHISQVKNAGFISFITKGMGNILKKVIGPSTGKSFLVKFFVFFLKALGVGLGAKLAGKAVRSLTSDLAAPGTSGISSASESSAGLLFAHNLEPENFGEDAESAPWAENVNKAQVSNLIADWAVTRFPQVSSLRQEMMNTVSFKKVINGILEDNKNNNYPNITYIPYTMFGKRVSSKAQVVELFIGEIAKKVVVPTKVDPAKPTTDSTTKPVTASPTQGK